VDQALASKNRLQHLYDQQQGIRMRQLSGSDAFFLFSDKPGQHQHISTIYIYDPSGAPGRRVRFKAILDHLGDRLDRSRIFRQKLVEVPFNLDYPYWIDDPDFSLDLHVRPIRLEPPADWGEFCRQVARLHSQPLDMTRPVWEMCVIEGLDNIPFLPKDAFAVMIKVHHAAIDDSTEEDFTTALHDPPALPDPDDLQSSWRPEKAPGAGQMLALAWFNNTTKLLETGQAIWANLPWVGDAAIDPQDVLHSSEEKAPETRFDREISPNRVWDACVFEMDAVESIMTAVRGATLNEVVLAVCSGAVNKYLDTKDELPDESLWALLPVHIHGSGEEGIPGHRVQLTRTRIMSDISDPLARFEAIVQEVTRVWEHSLSAEDINEVQDILPSTTMTMAAKTIAARFGPGRRYRENHNMIVSVIPGPEQPLYLCGARLIAFTGMGIILDNLALSHTVTTYDGKLTIAPICDQAIMPDPAFYTKCLQESFEELKDAVP
jgi:WS/DGAT/MGAT family acyltransferase